MKRIKWNPFHQTDVCRGFGGGIVSRLVLIVFLTVLR